MSHTELASRPAPPGTWYMYRAMVGVGVCCGLLIVTAYQVTLPVIEKNKAEAEKRRAMAVAREQEMRALVVENEAKVPLAMAEAFKKGNLGVMDYYKMKNVMADTSMRDSIAKPKKKE